MTCGEGATRDNRCTSRKRQQRQWRWRQQHLPPPLPYPDLLQAAAAGAASTEPLSKLVGKFTYLGSSVASTEKDIDTRLTKAWTAINRLSIICKSDLTDKMKRSFFQAAVASILLYGCTTWTLTKMAGEEARRQLHKNAVSNLEQVLGGNTPQDTNCTATCPPITKTIQVRRTRHAEHCWRSRDELISDVLLWTPTHYRAKAEQPARTYIQQHM